MVARFMTDPHEMRAMGGRFDVHAQNVQDAAQRMWSSSQSITAKAELAAKWRHWHYGADERSIRNIINMLHGVRDGLVRDANNYETQEQASQQILSS